MLDNRRRRPRVALETDVWVGQDGVFGCTGDRLANISLGGAFIETRSAYRVGTILNLRFAVQSSQISATVIVRNVRVPMGMGVEFLDLSPEGRARLETYLSGDDANPR